MNILINNTYTITDINVDQDAYEAQVYIKDTSTNEDYIANYDLDGDFTLHYDLCGSGEREVDLPDLDINFLDVVDYLNLEPITLKDLDIEKMTNILKSYIIEMLEEERQNNMSNGGW